MWVDISTLDSPCCLVFVDVSAGCFSSGRLVHALFTESRTQKGLVTVGGV